jgi:hypothetical protein
MEYMRRWLFPAVLSILWFLLSCGGSTDSKSSSSQDICKCEPTVPASEDYRHAAKHVSIPGGSAEEIAVDTILGWPVPEEPASDAGRSDRENQLFRIPRAYLQFAWLNMGDCDLHLEVSAVPDKDAPRVIVETPREEEYCSSRRALQSALAPMGVSLGSGSGELTPAVPVSVNGLAFQDFNHKRGTDRVKTPWELHPATVTVLPRD